MNCPALLTIDVAVLALSALVGFLGSFCFPIHLLSAHSGPGGLFTCWPTGNNATGGRG